MFKPKTERIEKLSTLYPEAIKTLEGVFNGPSNIYIDWANVIHWQGKLGWHFDLKRMKQFFDSFDDVHSVKIYTGTLFGNKQSEESTIVLKGLGYDVVTKPVKIIRISIDTSSIPENSPTLLQQFIKKCLLDKLNISTVTLLNRRLTELNTNGQFYIEDHKCNFDVELGRDMLRDFDNTQIKNYILWSLDSDFVDPVKQIRGDGKNAVIFATSGQVSSELAKTGNYIFDIKKIREFICWSKELPRGLRDKIRDA